jgi:hypothetical protein
LISAKEAADKACTTANTIILTPTSTATFVITAFIAGTGIVLTAKKAQIW